MSELIDQVERDRFVQLHGRNISVIAPAGVGKTTSIVERVVHLARLPEEQAVDRLSRLVVVTYTVRAAQQMQQRARAGIRSAHVSNRVQRAFQQTFFGTIHSYCVRLLERFGHYLGLPSPVGLLENDDELWHRFLLRGLSRDAARPGKDLLAFFSAEELYQLGRRIPPGPAVDPGPSPTLDWTGLRDFPVDAYKGPTKKALRDAQARALVWSEAWARGDRHHPLPKGSQSTLAPEFLAQWEATFSPLHAWLRHGALAFGRSIANAYADFRRAEAVTTYDDQVRLALRVLENPEARSEMAAERLSVLLDEAQDTDPRQFDVLLRVAGLGSEPAQTDDQSFSIVGDFQQAIYAPRSDLGRYRSVHDEIILEPRGTKSVLRVTFRCDRAIIAFVNRIFPPILNNLEGQSAFETLVPRDEAGPGQVLRWNCTESPVPNRDGKINAEARAQAEATFLAAQLAELGPSGLGARDWSSVALLCPRNQWLSQLQRELLAANLPVQLHTTADDGDERVTATWLAAIIWVMAHPEDEFEIYGVLREIFGVSDDDLARFTEGEGQRLRLTQEFLGDGSLLASSLTTLRLARLTARAMPLAQAVRHITETTHLRERLCLVEQPALVERDWDECLEHIATRAADGVTLAELADELRLGLGKSRLAEDEIRNEIQLMTSFKSKGLEWDAVIIPYVFREIGLRAPRYPRVETNARGEEFLSRDKEDFAAQDGEFVSRRDRQQFQRLLYVASTRARRSLIWIDDESLYTGQVSRKNLSAADLLGFQIGGVNREPWVELTAKPELVPPDLPAVADDVHLPSTNGPDLTRAKVEVALAHSRDYPRRVTPHALALHPEQDAEPEALTERDELTAEPSGPGIRYGTWWHDFIQLIPWKKPHTQWQKVFQQAYPSAPDPHRAEREWAMFLESDLAVWLAQPGRRIHPEWPFLLPEADGTCYEGVIDLAVFDESKTEWCVIDWKTNRLGAGGGAEISAIYQGQIAAYVRAIQKILSARVRGSLYLTPSGEWTHYPLYRGLGANS